MSCFNPLHNDAVSLQHVSSQFFDGGERFVAVIAVVRVASLGFLNVHDDDNTRY